MAFKDLPEEPNVPDTPQQVLLESARRAIPTVLPHQSSTLDKYVSEALNKSDVALQLPTGSGKTLVGILIAEWRRRKNQEKVVYLCPTNQLVNQVVEQSKEKYGITVNGFTGQVKNYSKESRYEYNNAERVAITTHSALFNSNPFFSDPDLIIIDDSHAAENYIAALWTLRIERENKDHSILHTSLANVIKPLIGSIDYDRLCGHARIPSDMAWVEKLPTLEFQKIKADFQEIIDEHVKGTQLQHSWGLIRENLNACHVYLSHYDILIRPLIPPTWTHAPFENARQRIYMSATLGSGGDLERITGRKNIFRLPIPEGWNKQGIGRRFFMFPEMSLSPKEVTIFRTELMKRAGRSLVLVPNHYLEADITDEVKENVNYEIFTAKDIEESKKPFIQKEKAVAIVKNRYDGIDFPKDDCRLLFIEGLPKATNSQEKFIMFKMGANVLYNERIQTRVLQAIGRCTRSLEDYSAVVLLGEELPDYLLSLKKIKFFHPELQAEIEFGRRQSEKTDIHNLLENFLIFMENKDEWERANNQIIKLRNNAVQVEFPAMVELQQTVAHEIEFQKRIWNHDYIAALAAAEKVLEQLKHPELRGYRALWHYLAGSAAWLGDFFNLAALNEKARIHFTRGKEAAPSVTWLVKLSQKINSPKNEVVDMLDKSYAFVQVEKLATLLESFGITHDRKFVQYEKEILDGLTNKDNFEQAQKKLGDLLGFEAGKVEDDASPDPWWLARDICFVFEDHANANATTVLDATKSRQAFSHPEWIKDHLLIDENATKILSIMVSPVTKATKGSFPVLKKVAFWPLDSFVEWAQKALLVIRELRTTFVEPGDPSWHEMAANHFIESELDALSIYNKFSAKMASDFLKQEGAKNE